MTKNNLKADTVAFLHNGYLHSSAYGEWWTHYGRIHISVFAGYEMADGEIRISQSSLGWQMNSTSAASCVNELLTDVGISGFTSENYEQIRRKKFIANSSFNAVAALENKTLGEVVDSSHLRRFVAHVFFEAKEVMARESGIDFSQYSIEDLIITTRFVHGFVTGC